MKAFVFASLDSTAFISFKCNWDANLPYSSLTCSDNFLAIRGALNDPRRLLSFPWPARKAFERERKRDFRAREEKRGEPFFFLPCTRALVPPNSFALPFWTPATQTIFFLDSLRWRCGVYLKITFSLYHWQYWLRIMINHFYILGETERCSGISTSYWDTFKMAWWWIYFQVVLRFLLSSSNRRRIVVIRCGVISRAAFIGDIASICGERGVYSRAAFNRVNKIMLLMIKYLSPAHI